MSPQTALKIEDAYLVGEDILRDAPSFQEGDFELISSDNVRFKVPSCYLIASRRVDSRVPADHTARSSETCTA